MLFLNVENQNYFQGDMWNCVEDRMENEDRMYSRVIRKLIFEDLYADRSAVLSRRPIAKDTLPQLKVEKIYDIILNMPI